jgi:hypothetical protein
MHIQVLRDLVMCECVCFENFVINITYVSICKQLLDV